MNLEKLKGHIRSSMYGQAFGTVGNPQRKKIQNLKSWL